MHFAKRLGALLAFVALLLSASTDAVAQEKGDFAVAARVGVAIPGGQFHTLTSEGLAVGGSLVYHISDHWGFRVDGSLQRLQEGISGVSGFVLSPPMDLLTIGGGFEVNFDRPWDQDLPFTFRVHVGAGLTQMKADADFDPLLVQGAFDESYPSVYGGAGLGYQVSEIVNVHVQASALLILVDAVDTFVFSQGTAGEVEPFDTAWSFPITAGVRITP